MSWVVVIFGSPAEDWCDLNHCPMEVIGPFAKSEEAQAEASRLPAGFRPHILPFRPMERETALTFQLPPRESDVQ